MDVLSRHSTSLNFPCVVRQSEKLIEKYCKYLLMYLKKKKFLNTGDCPFTVLGVVVLYRFATMLCIGYIPMSPILTDLIESTHQIIKYLADYSN